MKALRVYDGSLALADVPVPRLPGEALVKVSLSGICNTDLEIVKGYSGFHGTIGHEFVGIVEDGSGLKGKRVVAEINAGCGHCLKCMAGDPRHCGERTVLGIVDRDGAHAEYVSVPERNLLVVPDSVSDEKAVFVEPLAAALGITEQVGIDRETEAAVIGDGKLGLLCAMGLALTSERVTLIGKHSEKMEIAEKAGVRRVHLSEIGDAMRRSFDVVVEASGSESGFATALDLVRPRGKIVLKSTFQGRPAWEASRIVVDEITVVGSRCGRFSPALEVLASGSVDPTPLISCTYPLADAVEAMSKAAEKDLLKVLLKP